MEYGDDPTISTALVCAILVEVQPTFLSVINEVEALFGKLFLDYFFILASSKRRKAIYAKITGIDLNDVGRWIEVFDFFGKLSLERSRLLDIKCWVNNWIWL